MKNDSISRQAMLDGIDKLIKIHFDRTVVLYKARQVAENLPSVQPERKTGRWIDITNDESIDMEYKCSECGFEMFLWSDLTNFCPNCGAKMEGGEQS